MDEQLIPFRTRCSFRQYMPSKPDKYGMNLFLLCDCVSGYTFNGIPFIGRQGQQRNVNLAADTVKTLCEPLYFSEINVTTNNWFTSTNLAAYLVRKQITLLETMTRNKPDISKESQQERTGKLDRVCLASVIDKHWYLTCQRRTNL